MLTATCWWVGYSSLSFSSHRDPPKVKFSAPRVRFLICFRARNAHPPVSKHYPFDKHRENHYLYLELGTGAATLGFYARKASKCICQIQSYWEEVRLMAKTAFSRPHASNMRIPLPAYAYCSLWGSDEYSSSVSENLMVLHGPVRKGKETCVVDCCFAGVLQC